MIGTQPTHVPLVGGNIDQRIRLRWVAGRRVQSKQEKVPGQPKILSISAKGNPIDVTPRKGSQHVKKVPIPPQVPLRSTRNLLLEEYVFSMHQIGDLYKDIAVVLPEVATKLLALLSQQTYPETQPPTERKTFKKRHPEQPVPVLPRKSLISCLIKK
jgi:hypothetical protein